MAGITTELRYCASAEAVASLNLGGCEVAGFHVPSGEFEAEAVAHYSRWLQPAAHSRRKSLDSHSACINRRGVAAIAQISWW